VPLPFRFHAPLQVLQWLAVSAHLGRFACRAGMQGCEGSVFVRIHGLIGAAMGALAGPGPDALGPSRSGGGGGSDRSSGGEGIAPAGVGRFECSVVVQLFLFYVALVAPLAWGYAFDRAMRRRFPGETRGAASGGGAGGPGAAVGAGARAGWKPLHAAECTSTAAAVLWGLALLVSSWVVANAAAVYL
jgi:hypothetical protein